MKWILIVIGLGCLWYYVATGTLGGASKATQNYQDVMLGNKYSKENQDNYNK